MNRFRLASVLLSLSFALGLLPACGSEEECGGEGVICNYMGDGRAALGQDGVAPTEVSLYLPQDVTFGPDGRAYVLDWNNHRVRVVDEGVVETLVGTGELGDAPDGPASETRLNHPTHVAFSPSGKLVLSAWHNSKVMEMDLGTGEIEAICGTGARSYGGDGGPALDAIVDLQVATAFDSEGRLYIMDQGNQRIRRIESDGTIDTVVGPEGEYLPDGYVEVCEPPEEDFQAPDCRFCLAEEADDPQCAGPPARPQGFAGEGAAGPEVYMNQPFSQSAPPSGRMEMGPGDVLYFTDTGNHLVRALHPDGTVDTVAGINPDPYDATELAERTPDGGYDGDGGPALEARFNHPRDVAVAASDGSLYVADTDNSCVRKIDTEGIVSTVAGICGERGSTGDGGPATEALLDRPYGIGLDADDNLYIVDTYNHRIRVVYAQ
jgi:DNA-binding beta-propeller fold protein YncE